MNSGGFLEAAAQGTLWQEAIELKSARNGTPYASFSIAIATGRQDDAGKELLTWLRVMVFGDSAESIAKRAKRGTRVYCEGRLELTGWTTKDGEKAQRLTLMASKCELLGAGNLGRNKSARPVRSQARITQAAREAREPDFDDPMPF
jgi:single-strand DNA-binding protein